ncbi:PAS domain S-box-containing protein [Tranquillimonas rosea]|uniref:histidine kinase n=1 Tax=Tranquillimonas rosea TaxID=641238 RepID=A0A1H9TS20_9RHOB|nr:PAS domain-containing hybrid sensor histidine kinase/response regulator [Tranquillimonas rosea]SER99483.1 PAS domain S-box-containing protein [Tranquillimonas rosea]
MPPLHAFRAKLRRPARPALLVAGIALVAALVAWMAVLALREIDDLGTANSDNVQWSLAQMDVEYLRFRLAVADAQTGTADLDTVRRRFDVFYSRMSTLAAGEVFLPLRGRAEFESARQDIAGFLEATVSLIDGPDAELRAALPDIATQAAGHAEDVRDLSLAGLAAFAELSDERRGEVMATLARMALLLVVLFSGLALLAIWLLRLNRLSERRARQVEETGNRMRLIVETSLDGIIVSDADGRILDLNQSARRIFGYSDAEARGAEALSLFFPDEDPERAREGALRFIGAQRRPNPHERQFELVGRSRDGRTFPVEISVDRAEGPDGPIYVSFLRDISRRKAAEEGLTEARDRALAGEKAKAEFLAVMSHEMRTPLNGLLGSIQILRDTELDDRQSGLLDTMHSSGDLLLGLVNDVLDLSKYEAGKMRPEARVFDLQQLFDSAVETTAPLAAANDNVVSVEWIGPPAGDVEGDPRKLRQILLNLLGNALKFTHGGRVDIEAEMLGRDRLEIRVIDTGIGIAEADLDRVFQDFERADSSYVRQAGGTGLGLGIARRLVGILGGEIGAESEPGEGSLFWVRVPISLAGAGTAGVPAARTDAPRPAVPLSVLVVEDNEINRLVAREMLQADGHTVTEAVNGRAGVEWAERQRFDVILMDISMPEMDGQEAARRIRAGGGPSSRIPIVAVTAHALPEELARFREAGMELCVSKPIDRTVLSRVLATIGGGDADPGAGPASEAGGLIDTEVLSQLRQAMGDATFLTLKEKFLAETEETLAGFGAGIEPDVLAREAHKCAGSCAAFGVVEMRQALQRIEAEAKANRWPEAELRGLPALWARSRAALEAVARDPQV